MAKIFLSYRRSDSQSITDRIYETLAEAFGKDNVFQDVSGIPAGVNFKTYLERVVGECDVLLVVIGQQWLTIKDDEGNRRLDNPADYVRIEIEAGLKRDDVLVIPLLVDNARMAAESALPDSLRPLHLLEADRIRHNPDYARDMADLIQRIRDYMKESTAQRRKIATSGHPKKWRAGLAVIGVASLAALIVLALVNPLGDDGRRGNDNAGDETPSKEAALLPSPTTSPSPSATTTNSPTPSETSTTYLASSLIPTNDSPPPVSTSTTRVALILPTNTLPPLEEGEERCVAVIATGAVAIDREAQSNEIIGYGNGGEEYPVLGISELPNVVAGYSAWLEIAFKDRVGYVAAGALTVVLKNCTADGLGIGLPLPVDGPIVTDYSSEHPALRFDVAPGTQLTMPMRGIVEQVGYCSKCTEENPNISPTEPSERAAIYTDSAWGFGFGNFAIVRYQYDDFGPAMEAVLLGTEFATDNDVLVLYAHLSEIGELEVGQDYEVGTVIGATGATGLTDAPALYMEIRFGTTWNNAEPIHPDMMFNHNSR